MAADDTKKKLSSPKKKGGSAGKSNTQKDGAAKAKGADYSILGRPVITEKSSLVSSQSASGPGGTFVLRVDKRANKDDIKASIERVFSVNVVKVRTVNYSGKPKRTARSVGRRAGFKKAYVTLKEGQTVSLVEGL